ncbi:MAG: serine/threonine-protein kinase, partial [Myxococcales bacterium]
MTGTLPLGGGVPWTPPAGLDRQGVTPKPVSSLGPQEGAVAATSGEVNIVVANDAPRLGAPSAGLVSEGPYSDAPIVSRVPGPFKPGDMLNGYRIVKEIGCGGYARVYKAYDELIDTHFAIKVIFRPSANAKELDRRTKAEARFLWSVDHPYVVRVYAAGLTEAKSLYFVMELLEGRSLRSILLKRGELRWQDTLPLFAKIAEGVHAAHARSVIHRDLKPENIFVLKDGTPKVLDFGIAKFVDAP